MFLFLVIFSWLNTNDVPVVTCVQCHVETTSIFIFSSHRNQPKVFSKWYFLSIKEYLLEKPYFLKCACDIFLKTLGVDIFNCRWGSGAFWGARKKIYIYIYIFSGRGDVKIFKIFVYLQLLWTILTPLCPIKSDSSALSHLHLNLRLVTERWKNHINMQNI